MNNKLDYQFLIMQDIIFGNRQAYEEKMKKYDCKLDIKDSKLDKIMEMIKTTMVQKKNSNSPPDNMASTKA